jgi:hypothetical protein
MTEIEKDLDELSKSLLKLLHYQQETTFCLIGILDRIRKELDHKS